MPDLSDACGLPDCAARTLLIDDIAALADMFSSIMKSRYLRLRLDVIETNACRKFHIDGITARLICTYRGHATQYGNGAMGDSPADIHEVPTGSPMILRGTAWPSAGPVSRRSFLHVLNCECPVLGPMCKTVIDRVKKAARFATALAPYGQHPSGCIPPARRNCHS